MHLRASCSSSVTQAPAAWLQGTDFRDSAAHVKVVNAECQDFAVLDAGGNADSLEEGIGSRRQGRVLLVGALTSAVQS